VVTGKQDLEEDGDQEEETELSRLARGFQVDSGVWCGGLGYSHSNDGHCKRDLLQFAGHAKRKIGFGLV
jgi:hypothetical protein